MATQTLTHTADVAPAAPVRLGPIAVIAAFGLVVSAFLAWLCYYTYVVSPYAPFSMFG